MSETKEGQKENLETTTPLVQGWPVPTQPQYESLSDGEILEDEEVSFVVIQLKTSHQWVTGRPVTFGDPATAEAFAKFEYAIRDLLVVPRDELQADREGDSAKQDADTGRQYAALSLRAEKRRRSGSLGNQSEDEKAERRRTTEALGEPQTESIVQRDDE